jgi:hypothetical protein
VQSGLDRSFSWWISEEKGTKCLAAVEQGCLTHRSIIEVSSGLQNFPYAGQDAHLPDWSVSLIRGEWRVIAQFDDHFPFSTSPNL